MDRIEQKIRSTLDSIPGYRGYRSLEDRRDDDRRLRETIASEISASAATLTHAGAQMVERRQLKQVSAIERLVAETRHLADRVRTATYGYGGLFSTRDVGANVLDQIHLFDEAFLTESGALQGAADQIQSAPDGPTAENMNAYHAELVRLNTLFDARSRVVDTAQPERSVEILNLLEPPAPVVLSPVVGLARGDTFSIMGENYLVDAIVIIGEGDQRVVLARVGENAEGKTEWLLGGNTATVPTAHLVQAETTDVPAVAPQRRGEAMIVTASDTQRNVPIDYGMATGTGGQVTFWYTIGRETRVLQGTTVVDSDIEVFGQP